MRISTLFDFNRSPILQGVRRMGGALDHRAVSERRGLGILDGIAHGGLLVDGAVRGVGQWIFDGTSQTRRIIGDSVTDATEVLTELSRRVSRVSNRTSMDDETMPEVSRTIDVPFETVEKKILSTADASGETPQYGNSRNLAWGRWLTLGGAGLLAFGVIQRLPRIIHGFAHSTKE